MISPRPGALNWRWAWRTAWRDARGARGRAILYTLSMAFGMAALVAMIGFGTDLAHAVRSQTRELLGADLIINSREDFNEQARTLLAELPGEPSLVLGFSTMAFFPAQEQALLCRVRAVEGGFPFYGGLETEPAQAATAFRDGPFALVDESLMARLGAGIGDVVRIGQLDLTIAGVLVASPGEPPAAALFGPRVYIPGGLVDQTGLIQPGSRVFYRQAYRLPPGTDADVLVAEHEKELKRLHLSWDTVSTRQRELGESLAQLARFLALAGCLALLLGGVGVASAVYYHLKQKERQIAVMRCLGATTRQITLMYLIQVAVMAVLAAIAGAGLGLLIQLFLPAMVREFLPFSYEPTFQPGVLAITLIWGLVLSLLLTLAPLLGIRRISPLASLRLHLEGPGRDSLRGLVYALILITWWAFAVFQTKSFKVGSLFLLGLLVAILLLWLAGLGLAKLARRMVSQRLPFSWRHGIAALFRPQNQTGAMTVILGMGVMLMALLGGSRAILVGQFQQTLDENKPNFLAFDIQPDQVDELTGYLDQAGFAVETAAPLVPMRLESLKGKGVDQWAETLPEWALQHEYRSSYRDQLTATETLVAGDWVASVASGTTPVPVSLEDGIAQTLGLAVGDDLRVDVLGVSLDLRVASLRKVAWNTMQPNFFMVFPKGVLESAPQSYAIATRTTGPQEVARLQADLVQRFPNVTCVDLTQIVRNLDEILAKGLAIVRFMAGLCIAVGLLLLVSALWNSRQQRMGEYALLRTLGARRSQISRVALAESFLLGLFAALAGTLLAIIAGFLIAKFFFEIESPAIGGGLLTPLLILPLVTLLVGYLGQRGLWKGGSLNLLRREGG